ncbi:uncharacterized protein KRP23_11706 [Phytophthora ramorum]|uniref:uncharacterized protein n=1 Tax=Phytophthora ramorum TaxID=164328 RepID=UPI003098133A|nr:hypothetical protein KRP23_11706 [Phytophthora ramorum]
MRATQVLLATFAVLVGCTNGFVAVVDADINLKTVAATTDESTSASEAEVVSVPAAAAAAVAAAAAAVAAADDANAPETFVYKVPFVVGNITGTMMITIDKGSLHETSDGLALTDPSKVYDFDQLQKSASGSGEEDRGLFSFVASNLIQYKLTQKAVSWVKSIF